MSDITDLSMEIGSFPIYESELIPPGSVVSVQGIDGPRGNVTLMEWTTVGVVVEDRARNVTNKSYLIFLPFHRITSIVREP